MTSEIIDQASALEEMMRDHAIQAHRLNHSAVSATHCEECGDKLLDARRKAGLFGVTTRNAAMCGLTLTFSCRSFRRKTALLACR